MCGTGNERTVMMLDATARGYNSRQQGYLHSA